MSNVEATLPMLHPPVSSSTDTQYHELLQRGAFDPPVTPGTLGRLERFEILRLLGEGGMGLVYLAREPRADTLVAVKIVKPQLADNPAVIHSFLTEARHMYRLSHPRILRVLEVSDRKEGPYYVMPYIEGGSLLGLLGQPGQGLPDDRVLAVASQVAAALAHAHAHGLIHRDLKPGNVLMDRDGNAYLTDFGLVRTVFNDSLVDASSTYIEGTAPYMSPAVARGEAEDTRCDIYSFGALLYELLTGKLPYSGRTPQIILDQVLEGPPPPIHEVNPRAGTALVKVAEGCMARELRDRYATMVDVLSDLFRIANGAAPLGPHPKRRRAPKVAALLGGVFAIAALAGVVVCRSRAREEAVAPSPAHPPAATSHPGLSAAKGAASVSPPATDPHQFSCAAMNGTVTIAKYIGDGGAVVIPDTISGLPVTSIKNEAFLNCTNLASVTIPNSVTGVGCKAFMNCVRLAHVTIGNSVISLGKDAFSTCSSLTDVTIPASVTSLEGSAFSHCGSLTSIKVDFLNPAYSSSEDGVVFNKEKTQLVCFPNGKAGSYVVPSGVIGIGAVFMYCDKLASIALPSSVTGIKAWGFVGCGQLDEIKVDASNPAFSSGADGALFNKDKSCFVCCPGGKSGNYTILNGVTAINDCAFSGCSKLTQVTIPNSVKTIRTNVFRDCVRLVTVSIPNSVVRIGYQAFDGCAGMTHLAIPSSVTGIEGWAFVSCTSLASVLIPDSVVQLGECAFMNCTKLSDVLIGSRVAKIDNNTFLGCSSLARITVPDNVTDISYCAFRNCTGLADVTIGAGVTNIGDGAFVGCTRLASVYFKGNAPRLGKDVFGEANSATVYYLPGTEGWGSGFGGRPTAAWENMKPANAQR